MRKLTSEEILVYNKGRGSQQTIKRHYIQWRFKQDPPLPLRCDNTLCYFYDHPNIWNAKKLNFILDHKNGVNGDNSPKNLQLLCPNCNSQQSTHGGLNKGRIEQMPGVYSIRQRDGKKNYVAPLSPTKFIITGGEIEIIHNKKAK